MHERWNFLRTFISKRGVDAGQDRHGDRRHVRGGAGARAELRRLFEVIRAEHDPTVAEGLRVTGESELLDDQPELKRTLGVREPYLAPSYLKVDLLGRVRSSAMWSRSSPGDATHHQRRGGGNA